MLMVVLCEGRKGLVCESKKNGTHDLELTAHNGTFGGSFSHF